MLDPIYFLIIFIILQLLDITTTYIAISSGKSKEANPVMNWFFTKLGMLPSLIIIKTIVIILFGLIYTQIPIYAWIILIAIYVLVVLNNVYHILKNRNG